MTEQKLWFKRKRYGWGWVPVSWEGWAVTLSYVLLGVLLAFTLDRDASTAEIALMFVLPVALLTAAFIRIAYRKGEAPRWQWGDDEGYTVGMKNVIVGVVIVIALLIAGFYALNAYIYHEKQADESAFTLGEYGYRCGDGTEFTMSPRDDMSEILITPATSVERIGKTILTKVESESGARYEGDGLTFAARGETVTLATAQFETTCLPMQEMDEAPFNFGD